MTCGSYPFRFSPGRPRLGPALLPRIVHGAGAWHAATGNGYEGGLQFLRSTWESVGGAVDKNGRWASVVPAREQLYRAWLVWKRDGRSWREWGTARACGLI